MAQIDNTHINTKQQAGGLEAHRLSPEEQTLVSSLRHQHQSASLSGVHKPDTLGDRVADRITGFVGSWRFLIIQSSMMDAWLVLNVVAYIQHWDPYPFILLNLILSFQAAYTAPIIMMSQNREAQIDRRKLETYYKINLKQELEIKLLHQKIDDLHAILARIAAQAGSDAR